MIMVEEKKSVEFKEIISFSINSAIIIDSNAVPIVVCLAFCVEVWKK